MEPAQLKPYTSVLLGRRPGGQRADEFLAILFDDLESVIGGLNSGAERSSIERFGPDKQQGLWFAYLCYIERRAPSWAPDSELRDRINRLVVACVRDRFVAIHASDSSLGRRLGRTLGTAGQGALSSVQPIPVGTLNTAFGHGPARTLWLSGIHRRVESKADSKMLSGIDLGFALDPLGDQTYYFTAARTAMTLPNLPPDRSTRAIGFNPRKSRAWAGPSRDWSEFARLVHALLGRLKNSQAEPPDPKPLPVLAAPAEKVEEIETPYDLSIIAPELLSETPESDAQWLQKAERWAYDARFDIKPTGGPDFDADVYLRGVRLGTLGFDIHIDSNGEATWEVNCRDEQDEQLREARDVCTNAGWLVIRYESGHTLSNGMIYSTRFRDIRFDSDQWRFYTMPGTDVTKEKPPDSLHFDPAAIGSHDSLFCWVQRNWPPPGPGVQSGWLACDDGAGEIADFVHVDTTHRIVTLIHVKASHSEKSNRQISTSDYEVVVGQAVKNLRMLDRINLAERLKEGNAKSVAAATWKDGIKQPDRSGLIQAVRELGANYSRKVVILQPRVTAAEYQRARDEQDEKKQTSRVRRMQQLDALLIEAESSCRDLGAEFIVIGEQV